MKENSIEEDMAKVNTYIELVLEKDYCNCNELNTILGKHCDGSKNVAYAIEHILSDYKRVLKENEELNNRCRNLDKEAQAYLEELAGDNTLTRRTIKQLQEENEECKLDVQDYLKQAQENAEMYRKAQKKIQDLKAENEELKNNTRKNENELEFDIDCDWIALQKMLDESEKSNEYISYKNEKWIKEKYCIPVQKVKDKIEFLEEEGYWLFTTDRDSDKCVEVLQELLESEERK